MTGGEGSPRVSSGSRGGESERQGKNVPSQKDIDFGGRRKDLRGKENPSPAFEGSSPRLKEKKEGPDAGVIFTKQMQPIGRERGAAEGLRGGMVPAFVKGRSHRREEGGGGGKVLSVLEEEIRRAIYF